VEDGEKNTAHLERLDVTWVEGDAQSLRFDDGLFNAVLSSFGIGWAPDHEASAREAVRVLRPGGVLGLCHWIAEGLAGGGIQFFNALLPESAQSRAWLWGDESHVESLFADLGVQLSFERGTTAWTFGSVEEFVRYVEEKQPNAVIARRWSGLENASHFRPSKGGK
jgi:SAM-dependent methyltransferase